MKELIAISELCDALEKANAEIERLREAQRWRELEEEPCGDIGQKALLYGIGGVDVGEYLGEGDWNVEYRVMPGETFTHWMPLPAPPMEAQK